MENPQLPLPVTQGGDSNCTEPENVMQLLPKSTMSMDETALAKEEGGTEVQNQSDCQGLFAVKLEKTVFARWCEIKMAEGFVSDSQMACLLFQRYSGSSREGEQWHSECLHCHTHLALSLLCASCQTLSSQSAATHTKAVSMAGQVTGDSKASVASTQWDKSQGQVTVGPMEADVIMVTDMKAEDGGVERTGELSQCEDWEGMAVNRDNHIDGEDYDGDTDVDSFCTVPQLPKHSNSAKSTNTSTDLKPVSEGGASDCDGLVEKSSYECEQCSKTCPSSSILSAHMEKEHGMNDSQSVVYEVLEREEGMLFKCRQCGKLFPTRSRVQSHAVIHSNAMPYCCEFCKRQFKLSSALHVHKINIHSGVKPFKCDQCDVAYAFNSDLSVHKRMHEEDRPFVCSDCGLAYKKSNHLSGHKKRIHGSTNLTQAQQLLGCEICQKKFKFKSSWKLHMRCHNKKMQSGVKGNTAYSKKRELTVTEHMKAHDMCYTCTECGKDFSKKNLLQGHMQEHSEKKPFVCIHCDKCFKFKRGLFAHRKAEHWVTTQKENQYKCEQCDSSFRYKIELTRHKRIHKDERPYVCGECGAKYKRSTYLRMHENGHEDMRNAVCHVCGKCCLGLKSLAKHIKIHHNIEPMVEKPYKCLDCTAAFALLSQLTSHRGVHTQQHPFVCHHCGRAFRTEHTLTIHVRKHTGERPFQCSKCQEAFADKCALKRHEIHHSPQSKELCHVCGASFPTKAHLAVHIQRHSTDRPYKCSQCGKGYKTTSDLNKHVMFHSDDKPFQCSDCSYAFHTKAMLTKHLRKHTGERPYRCEQCSATFAYFSSLAAHRKLHSNNKPFICDVCGASFFTAYNLRLHSRKHSGERPYQCHLCPESFSWHSGLKCHLKKHQPGTVV